MKPDDALPSAAELKSKGNTSKRCLKATPQNDGLGFETI